MKEKRIQHQKREEIKQIHTRILFDSLYLMCANQYKYVQKQGPDKKNTRLKKIFVHLARFGSVDDFCFGVKPVLLPNKLEVDELILVLGVRNGVVLVLNQQ